MYDITNIFESLELKNTGDLWGISVKLVRSVINIVVLYLSNLLNRCVDSRTFPDIMNMVIDGNRTNPSNLRPISIMPAFSKIFENLILTN